jgi:hypothetical protein
VEWDGTHVQSSLRSMLPLPSRSNLPDHASPQVIHRLLSSDLHHNKTVEARLSLLRPPPISSNCPYNPPNVPSVGPMDYRLDGLFPSRSAAPSNGGSILL